ncbi:MAG: RES domain-containing protein, partial [Deltaproteobacteria bacterium]|nr:RES domain-containing protein [Deltaproteobacteria bacterium]
PNWRDYPAPEQLADIGTGWLKSKSSLLLEIPSAVVNKEMNILINPLHQDIKSVSLVSVESFSFDSRLLQGT